MKTTLSILLLALALNSQAQDKKIKDENTVPSEVRNAFRKTFPTAKVTWELEKDGNYEGEFKLKGKDASTVFDKAGHMKELETEIAEASLPEAARKYLQKNYPDKKIKEAAQITDDKGIVTYEAEIRINGKSTDILFDSKGNLLK
ncbi:PepSY-like domain-containing protein [Flavobacterium sp.]|uniref:PepSY-like domain-containing protein n=1 Tax=Flavobacterium sp. TaxID=239 RepID=UPI003B9A5DE0